MARRNEFGTRVPFALLLLALLGCASEAPVERAGPVELADPVDDAIEAPIGELPEPSEPYVTRQRGNITWVYPQGSEDLISNLRETHESAWPELEDDFGTALERTLEVRVARNPGEMAELAPVGAPPPPYATGVAYTARGLILLSMIAPESWEVPDLETVFVHELSHIALRRATGGHPLPRWFVEGVAVNHAGERTLDRLKTLWNGERSGALFPLDTLSDGFPARSHEVNLAYAQAADVVAFMRDDRDGRRFRELIEELAEGDGFTAALDDAYARTPGVLEQDWRDDLSERVSSVPLLVGGSTIWVLAVILLVMAYRKKRALHHQRMAEMEAQEKADTRAILRIERMAEEEPWLALPKPGESDVPKIRHEGKDHTLH